MVGLSVERLSALNGLDDPDYIAVGQVLTLTGDVPLAPAGGAYTVQPGDTLSGIAAARGLTADLLARWNGLADPDRILPGMVLQLGGEAPSARPTNTPGGPLVEWISSPNYWPGRFQSPIALVLHTMGGSLAGTEGQFTTESSKVSAHFGIGLDGRIHQYVELGDRAWANGSLEPGYDWPGPAWINPNDLTVSIETEDLGSASQPVTDEQFRATVAVGRAVLARYPSIRYLVTHRAISPLSRAVDPGKRWTVSGRFTALARELGLQPIE
jgi:LysM repeat protein